MTAALYRCSLDGVSAGSHVILDGPEGHHAATVKRTKAGEHVFLADGSGLRARAEVVTVEPRALHLRVLNVEQHPDDGRRVVLVQALAKGGRDEQAVQAATELGVDAVWAWQADRCIVRWRAERALASLAKWKGVADAAAKQARRAAVPRVQGPLTSADLAERMRAADLVLVLHEEAETPLAGIAIPPGEVLIVVGPEGGITPQELTAFEQAGGRAVRLGLTVLRSGTAGPAALAVVLAATRWR